MAIGDTINAGLMRVDFSPIQRAGEAQARANQAFGQAIGGVIDKFYQKKKDKQEREEREQAYRQMGLSDEEAKAASRDKDLANQFIDKMNADRNFNEASALRNLQMQQILRNMERQKDADLLADEARQKEEAQAQIYDRFLIDREMVNMPIGGGEANHLMKNVPPPTIQVPRGEYKGNRFFQTEQGKSDFTSLVDAGMDASDALEMASKREAQLLASQPKAPDPQVQIKNENDLRKEFNSLPEVKDFNKVRTSYDKVVLAGENPSAAGDISMIFNYMKILDPGSVVREGEFATAQNAAGVPQRVINQYNKIVKGERLSEDQRSDFMNQARFAAEAQFKPVAEQMTRYQGVARNMGLRLDQVLPTSFLTMGEQLGQEFKTKPDSNSDANSITTDQGNYTIPGLSVEAQ